MCATAIAAHTMKAHKDGGSRRDNEGANSTDGDTSPLDELVRYLGQPVDLPEVNEFPNVGPITTAPSTLSPDQADALVRRLWSELSSPLQSEGIHDRLNAYQGLCEMRERVERAKEELGSIYDRKKLQLDYLTLLLDCCQSLPESARRIEVPAVQPDGIKIQDEGDGYVFALTEEELQKHGLVAASLQSYDETVQLWVTRPTFLDDSNEAKTSPPVATTAVPRWQTCLNQFRALPTWKDIIKGFALLVDIYSRTEQKKKRGAQYANTRLRVLQTILFQFEAYGQVATFPPDYSPSGNGEDENPRIPVALHTKSRAEGTKTQIHEDVRQWAVNEYRRLLDQEGLTAEVAKNQILSTAARYDYHFSRRTLERYI